MFEDERGGGDALRVNTALIPIDVILHETFARRNIPVVCRWRPNALVLAADSRDIYSSTRNRGNLHVAREFGRSASLVEAPCRLDRHTNIDQ
jgi:hypothetical protein